MVEEEPWPCPMTFVGPLLSVALGVGPALRGGACGFRPLGLVVTVDPPLRIRTLGPPSAQAQGRTTLKAHLRLLCHRLPFLPETQDRTREETLTDGGIVPAVTPKLFLLGAQF